MRQALLASALAGILASAAGGAELGPKDGGDLPPADLGRVSVGSSAPDFTLEDATGSPVTLSEVLDETAVVLVFYRGHW